MSLTRSSPEGVHFEVWAPKHRLVSLQTGSQTYAMEPDGCGFFAVSVGEAKPGDCYRFLLDGHLARPDPFSRFQPEGVHGPSQIVDPAAYSWRDAGWRGIPKQNLVVYEIHTGTFTREGTYAAACAKLSHVLDLGATAVELLPVAQTPGRWNWGYDGVDLYAPNHIYGSPDDLRRFVDTCHGRGLAVILDVVYNHLGPEGSYWADFGPYFSYHHRTPWGPALNFDGSQSRPVRDWVIGNAMYWLEEFHVDGLRLDAIHLMQDGSAPHITAEISAAVHRFAATQAYPIHLIAESNVHDQKLLDLPPLGSGYDLLWNDEIPHALFSTALGQHQVHNRTYRGGADLKRALGAGFVFEWESSGRDIVRNNSGPRADLAAMLQGLQTHDQIGNHPQGFRLHQVASPALQQVGAALVLLHPAVPLCFMGEEFAAPSPFCFFVDFGDPRLRHAVVEGRKRDYAHHNWDTFISPVEEQTFLRSKLALAEEGLPGMFAWYRTLIALRKEGQATGWLRPELLSVEHNENLSHFTLRYGDTWHVTANFSSQPVRLPDNIELRLHSRWPEFGGNLAHGESRDLPALSAAVFRTSRGGSNDETRMRNDEGMTNA